MDVLDTAAIFRFHQGLIHEHGEGNVYALGWTDPESQSSRYKVLSTIADLNDRSVMDAGCGHGDLRPYLGSLYPNLRYFGIEQIPSLLNIAIERYSHLPETVFLKGDFSTGELPVTDYIIACGSLSYRNSDPLYVYKTIEKLFSNCKIGFGFNLLSKTYGPQGVITSYSPVLIMNFCGKLTANCKLIEGYRKDDFTVMMYH